MAKAWTSMNYEWRRDGTRMWQQDWNIERAPEWHGCNCTEVSLFPLFSQLEAAIDWIIPSSGCDWRWLVCDIRVELP